MVRDGLFEDERGSMDGCREVSPLKEASKTSSRNWSRPAFSMTLKDP